MRAVYVKTNDQMLVVYVASMIRSIVALHNLINNKIQNRDAEKNEGGKSDKKKESDKDKKDTDKDKDKKDGDKEKKDSEKSDKKEKKDSKSK